MRAWWIAAALVLAALAAACGSDGDDDNDGDETPTSTATATATSDDGGLVTLEGVFETSFEHSAFYPQDVLLENGCPQGADRYWVAWTEDSNFAERVEDESGVPPFAGTEVLAFRIELRGELSEPGEYGHLGQYPRELTVHEVVAASQLTGCEPGGSNTPIFDSPPEIVASNGTDEIALGIGTYCWTGGPGAPGLCADAIGLITNLQPLRVSPGQVLELTTALDLTTATQIEARAQQALGLEIDRGPDWIAWRPDDLSKVLPLSTGPGPATLAMELDPGEYVIGLSVFVPQGDVHYGLYVEVVQPSANATPTPQATVPATPSAMRTVALGAPSCCPSARSSPSRALRTRSASLASSRTRAARSTPSVSGPARRPSSSMCSSSTLGSRAS